MRKITIALGLATLVLTSTGFADTLQMCQNLQGQKFTSWKEVGFARDWGHGQVSSSLIEVKHARVTIDLAYETGFGAVTLKFVGRCDANHMLNGFATVQRAHLSRLRYCFGAQDTEGNWSLDCGNQQNPIYHELSFNAEPAR